MQKVIKDWSFLKERRAQLAEGEYAKFQAEVARRRWTQLTKPMAKYDPEVVMEFYANAWPTEEGVMDKCFWVWGQWIPYDTNAINQLLGHCCDLPFGGKATRDSWEVFQGRKTPEKPKRVVYEL